MWPADLRFLDRMVLAGTGHFPQTNPATSSDGDLASA